MKIVSVFSFGAKGNGEADDTQAIQKALDSGAEKVIIPFGIYKICKTLKIHSNTILESEYGARIYMDGETEKQAGDYLITNADFTKGNENISLVGGIWDGNNEGKYNTKGDIFDLSGYSGTVINFFNVKNLEIRDLIVANSVTYNIRMAKIDGFKIENIGFLSDVKGFNQDGLHFNGEVRNGKIKNIIALSKGQTNDDLLAFNADDSMERVENIGMVRGAIENIEVENVYASDCHTAIRMLSVNSPIRNIKIKNINTGFRCYAINMDSARYCRTPLFDDEKEPMGVGIIENVYIENMKCHQTHIKNKPDAAVLCESLTHNFEIKDFDYTENEFCLPAFKITNVTGMEVISDGEKTEFKDKSHLKVINNFKNLVIK